MYCSHFIIKHGRNGIFPLHLEYSNPSDRARQFFAKTYGRCHISTKVLCCITDLASVGKSSHFKYHPIRSIVLACLGLPLLHPLYLFRPCGRTVISVLFQQSLRGASLRPFANAPPSLAALCGTRNSNPPRH